MKTDQDKIQSKNKKSALYAGIAYLSLLMLALFWSADISLVYLFSGIAFYFLFLTLKGIPFKQFTHQHDFVEFEEVKEDKETGETVFNNLKDELENKGISFDPGQKNVTPQHNNQSIILLAVAAIFISVFIFITIGIFSTDNNDQFYLQQAEIFYNQGEYDSATTYYKKALSLNKESPEALTGLANTFMIKQQNDSAIMFYDNALSINPEFETARYQKALVLYYQNRYRESVIEAKSLLELNPQYFEAMQLVGDNFYNQEKYDSAITWYDSAYTNGVRNRYLCHLMGYINQTKGKTQRAIALYKEALQYDSSVVDIYERLADIVPENEKDWYRRKISALQPEP